MPAAAHVPAHATQQAPQFFGSVPTSTHAPPQTLCPASQAQPAGGQGAPEEPVSLEPLLLAASVGATPPSPAGATPPPPPPPPPQLASAPTPPTAIQAKRRICRKP